MIEPIAEVVKDERLSNPFIHSLVALNKLPDGTKLTTVADVLAELREPSEAMIKAYLTAQRESCLKADRWLGVSDPKENFKAGLLAMLDQFECDQGSAT